MKKPTLLLHVCCATCAAYVYGLLSRQYGVTAYYYNPNIYPKEEYSKRYLEAQKYFFKNNVPFIEEKSDQDRWLLLTRGHEQDPEKGERCTICYRMRLERTAEYAQTHGFDYFTTDLSISPHKDAQRLNILGKELELRYGVTYFEADFKKNDGFKKAMAVSRKEDFYRQNYCGCRYSMKKES